MDAYPQTLVLHWNYRGFTRFPIDQLIGDEPVTDIYLKENLISNIPADIGKLVHLESLYLSGNDITELPKEISKLRCLKCLDVSGNRLRYIPEEIGDVRGLKFLILDENEIKALPLRLAELRQLRYLSVCDNKLEWLPQKPMYNYHHCEFRFWRNYTLTAIPYSLWYHMFRGQQIRCLNIGCLSFPKYINMSETNHHNHCRLKLSTDSREWTVDIQCPPQHNTIMNSNTTSPPSLLEMCKRVFYEVLSETAGKLSQTQDCERPYSYKDCSRYYENNIEGIEQSFEDINIENGNICDLNGNHLSQSNWKMNKNTSKIKKRDYYCAADVLEEHYGYLPNIIKHDLKNGPISRCEHVGCKKPLFDFATYEFCLGNMILIDNTEEILLSATFCSKTCADVWNRNKPTIPWELLKHNQNFDLIRYKVQNKNFTACTSCYQKTLKMITVDDTKPRDIPIKKPKLKGSTEHPYFVGHVCSISKYHVTKYQINTNVCCRLYLKLVCVRQGDPRARLMFRSYDALCAEKFRQYKDYPLSIHPFSIFRFLVEFMFVITISITNIMISIHYSTTDPDQHPYFKTVITVLESLYVINILINFFTGYVTGNTTKYVDLGLKYIFCRYLRTWFIIDALSSSYIFLGLIETPKNSATRVIVSILMVGIKILRIPTLFFYTHNVLTAMRVGALKKDFIEICMYLMTFLTWNIFFQFAFEYYNEGDFTPASPSNCSWITIADLWNSSFNERYAYALNRAVGMLRCNSNLHMIKHDGCFEVFFVVSGMIALLLTIHCALKHMIHSFGGESARAKYYMMTQQVQTYMDQRKYPPRIRKKILKFYAIRFMSHYFNEAKMMACVSGKLREDIIMHTGRQLVSDVRFLKMLPRALLLQIEMKLKIVVFIAGDIIFKFNTLGDCLYFIDKGTVAIYSESGKEVCHLEDGDFFGEIALVMKRRYRTASVVAVTNCQLFRLDRDDFESTIACYPTVYEDIKKVARNRFEKTNVLDEHHKSQLMEDLRMEE